MVCSIGAHLVIQNVCRVAERIRIELVKPADEANSARAPLAAICHVFWRRALVYAVAFTTGRQSRFMYVTYYHTQNLTLTTVLCTGKRTAVGGVLIDRNLEVHEYGVETARARWTLVFGTKLCIENEWEKY